jgi:serine/threonine protein kinase/tetratricopeptide (TPR) repeat protein
MHQLGRYKLLKSLGKGGMGEVFLAHDEVCQREVALKKIREDLLKYKTLQQRFLREAKIAAQLTHPSIIPIFSIHEDENLVYYTMPYVEGDTLKNLIRLGKEIAPLMRIFLNVCQAIAYSHAKEILHRDLKPENIIVGKFGEVLLLDWGLAELASKQNEEVLEEVPGDINLTRPGKVVGTLPYLAPERASGETASQQTDLYALGVILYQLLTLKLPFKRPDLQTFQKMVPYEQLIDPIEAAPYRDIPHQLVDIVKKCLEPKKAERYGSVAALITDLETYIEGRPDWLFVTELKMENKQDWEFQENILLAKHIAITRSTEVMEWVSLMISRGSFSGNTKIEAVVRLGAAGDGIGFLLNIPNSHERKDLMDGYCLWIGSKEHPGCKLFRSNIEVMRTEGVFLEQGQWHQVRIEKTDNALRFYLDGKLRCHYISHTPLAGTHIGLICRDADFELKYFRVFIGSQNVMVSCLAVPDAFLATKEFDKALIEYRRIAASFPGRMEEREALFRAGVTLLEEGTKKRKARYFSLALEEFGKLRGTSGAPLEYLGKSLVYKAMGEIEEEVKCLELAIRKYAHHPLLPRLVEHTIFRLHESSTHNRLSAYYFALLCLRQLPEIFKNSDHQKLIDSLKTNWEPLHFLHTTSVSVPLAFLLAKPITLLEIIESGEAVEDALFSLLELGALKIVKESPRLADFPEIAQVALEKKPSSDRALLYLFRQAIDHNKVEPLLPLLRDDVSKIFAHLWLGNQQQAATLLESSPLEVKTQDNSPLFPLFGCYLWMTEGEKIGLAHFQAVSETPHPRTSALLGHFLTGKINLKKGWIDQAFFWEKAELFRQLILFYRCLKQPEKVKFFTEQLAKAKRQVLKR